MQHRPISDPIAGRRIGSAKQDLDFLAPQIGNQTSVGPLERDRQNAADLVECRRLPVLEEAEEGLDRRQSNIAGLWSILTRVLQILQEGTDQFRVELLKRQRRWRGPEPCRGKLEQQLEAVCIGIACVLAGTSMMREIVVEEGFDERGYRRHHCSPRHMNVSPMSAMSRGSSAVASRYQYVA